MDQHQPDPPRNGIEQFRPLRPVRPDAPDGEGDSAPGAKRSKSSLSIVLAGGALLLGIAVLIVLMGPVAPVLIGAIGMVLLLAGLAAFHYVVWGWWLGSVIRSEVEADEEAKRQLEQYAPPTDKPEPER
jgi:hypothetical protein